MATYDIWYMKPDFFRDGSMGYEWLVERDQLPTLPFEATHAFVRTIEAASLEHVFMIQQGEVWSPKGEARPLIKAAGLAHTSMSVGDIAIERVGEARAPFMVDRFGFRNLINGREAG